MNVTYPSSKKLISFCLYVLQFNKNFPFFLRQIQIFEEKAQEYFKDFFQVLYNPNELTIHQIFSRFPDDFFLINDNATKKNFDILTEEKNYENRKITEEAIKGVWKEYVQIRS